MAEFAIIPYSMNDRRKNLFMGSHARIHVMQGESDLI